MPRIQVKPADQVAAKWQQRSQGAGQAYKDGVEDPNVQWAENTANAADAYRDGVTQAIGRNAFANGVKRGGNAAWSAGASKKGVQRWAPGIAQAKDAFVEGTQPVFDALARLDLPPRRPKRDPANMERVQLVVKTLGDYKMARQKVS
jgi:hypothetical protein